MNELFYNISKKNREKLLAYLEAISYKYPKNKEILSNMINDNIICIILSGHLQIVRNDIEGNRTIVEDFLENSLFGSLSYPLKNEEYQVITKEETKVVVIDFNSILNMKENRFTFYNQFLKNLINILTTIIAKANERIEVLSNKSIRDKLLDYFRILSKKTGSKVIYLPMSYTELADYLAVNRSALSREIKNLKDDMLIETKGKRIKLLYYINWNKAFILTYALFLLCSNKFF